jgi:Flp pilus assembly protein TadG
MRRRHLHRNRSGAVALLFATMIIPMLGLVGLAIDYGIWNEAYSTLSVAASAAALNAAKTSASALALADSNYVAEGITSGQQWFLAELGKGAYAVNAGTTPPTVTITTKANYVTATVTFSSTVNSIFGKVFRRTTYPINVTTSATMSAGSYLEVVLMLDNSSSMGIGADTAAMTTMMQNTPCDPSNAYTRTSSNSTYTQAASEDYSLYQYNWQGVTYNGAVATPVVSGSLTLTPATPPNASTTVSYCPAASSVCPKAEICPSKINGYTAYAGPPCAFACHSDSSKAAGLGNDLWHTARVNGVTLRLDTLKVATNKVLTAMQSNNISSINNLSVGIYTFNTKLNPIYPGTGCTPQAFGCEAGSDWSTAISDVGSPPVAGSGVYTDTGIQPPVAATSGNNDNTEVEEAMSNLANNYVTAAGDGSTATKSRKVLMLITDGYEDDPTGPGYSGLRQAMPASACTPFKNMGYTVYVIYTPYYPLMHTYYLANMVSTVEGNGPASIIYNLQACASNANDFITATTQSSINAALLAFLTDALDSPATFTQ